LSGKYIKELTSEGLNRALFFVAVHLKISLTFVSRNFSSRSLYGNFVNIEKLLNKAFIFHLAKLLDEDCATK
jgi:hypothetical protein